MSALVFTWVVLQATLLAAGVAARLSRGADPALGVWIIRGLLAVAVVAPLLSLGGPELDLRVAVQPEMMPSGAPALPTRQVGFHVPWVELLMAAGFAPLGLALARIGRVLASAVPLRRLGRVRIVASRHTAVPFALRTPGCFWIVLDAASVESPELAVTHELAHHRRGDPAWAWLEELVAALSPLAALLWRPVLLESIELATDQRATRRIPASTYARGLLDAAARLRSPPPALARSAWASTPLLRRRIEMLRHPPSSRIRALLALVVGLPLTVSTGLAADGRALLHPASSDTPALQAALDTFQGTEKGRAFIARGVAGRAIHGAKVDAALAAAGLPAELAAIPLVESAYANFSTNDLPSDGSMAPGCCGAGLWMFIPSTARNYGLRVDTQVDERLDLDKETAAAVRLLTDLHARYQDWPLAIAAYNMGPRAVDEAIAAGGTRDAWALVEQGRLNNYLPLVTAAAEVLDL